MSQKNLEKPKYSDESDEFMALNNVEREIQCVTHWFNGWSTMQKDDFMRDLLDKLLPINMESLFDSMKSLGVGDKPPSIFQCQLKLFSEWFSRWTDSERNDFMIKLQCMDANFVSRFNAEASRLAQNQQTSS